MTSIEHPHPEIKTVRQDRSFFVQALFVAAVLASFLFFREMPTFQTLSITFVSIVLEALPFMLIGTVVGGFIEVFISQERMTQFLPKRRWVTVVFAAALGIVFPVCECAIVPVVRRLIQKGAPLGAAIAFLLGGPIVNPIVAASTAVAYAFKWPIVLERLVMGYGIAVAIGILMDALFSQRQAVLPEILDARKPIDTIHTVADQKPYTFFVRTGHALRHAASDFFDITRFLVMGAFFTGVLHSFLARDTMLSFIGHPVVSILFMMILAVMLNLCSEADAFVAASFRSTPMPMTAQMAFMVLGPMLDIKLLMMYTRVFRKPAILTLAGLVFLTVFVVAAIRGLI